jgi:hypothetical protein
MAFHSPRRPGRVSRPVNPVLKARSQHDVRVEEARKFLSTATDEADLEEHVGRLRAYIRKAWPDHSTDRKIDQAIAEITAAPASEKEASDAVETSAPSARPPVAGIDPARDPARLAEIRLFMRTATSSLGAEGAEDQVRSYIVRNWDGFDEQRANEAIDAAMRPELEKKPTEIKDRVKGRGGKSDLER